MGSGRFKVIGIGELCWDVYPENRYIGGSAANVAVHASYLNDDGIIVSRVGKDTDGAELISAVRMHHMPTDYIQTDNDYPTARVSVTLDSHGNAAYRCTHSVAFDQLQFADPLSQLTNEAHAIYFSLLGQRHPIARETILTFLRLSHRAMKVFDMNIRRWSPESEEIIATALTLTDVIKANHIEWDILYRVWADPDEALIDFIRRMMKKYAIQWAAITDGEAGCRLIRTEQIVEYRGKKINVKDSSGAGDAFSAALIHLLLRGEAIDDIAKYSSDYASRITQYEGATPRAPVSDIKQFRDF